MKLKEKINAGEDLAVAYVDAVNCRIKAMADNIDVGPAETAKAINGLMDVWQSFVGAVRSEMIQFDNGMSEADNDC